MSSAAVAILITLVVYKVTLLVIGLVAQRRTRSEEDFFLGGRNLGPWVAAISASASSSSAWTLLGVSGFAYTKGLSALWLFPACVGGFCLNFLFVAPRLNRLRAAKHALTVTELIAGDGRRSEPIRLLGSTVIFVFFTVYIASQLQGAGKTFESVFAIDSSASIIVGAVLVIAYTLIGGFWAVSLTDTLQGLVMALSSLLLPIAALVVVGGPGRLIQGIAEIGGDYASITGGAGLAASVGMVAGLLGIGLGYPGQPHVVNRFMALEDRPGALKRLQLIGLGWAAIVYSGMILTGLAGRLLVPELGDAETVFVALAERLFHPVVAGVMIAAVVSAIMSTADSQLLVAASSVSHDLGFGAARGLAVERAVVATLGILATGLALVGPKEIFVVVLVAWSALGATFGPSLLVLLWRGHLSRRRALQAMIVGLTVAIIGSVLKARGWTVSGAIIERALSVLIGIAVACAPDLESADQAVGDRGH